MKYVPEQSIALVRLIEPAIKGPKKKYDTITEGEIIALHEDDIPEKGHLIGKVGHWREYKDDLRLKDNYAFIELTDIFGYEEE